MGWQERDALDRNAEHRLRQLLGRQPTADEIAQLRLGEQALGLEDPALAKAREARARAKALRDLNQELVTELQEKQQRKPRGRLLFMKKRPQNP